jgi:hypothetical protein
MRSVRYRKHPSYYPNKILKFLKWPVAILALVSLPFYLLALFKSSLWELSFNDLHRPLLGLVIYIITWSVVLKRRFMGSGFSTFEHELTHAIFAWLTLHRVVGLKITWNSGGSCMIEGSGEGNWAIAIAPYWFPTLLFPVILAESISSSMVLQYGVGAVMGYHLLSTWRELHPEQTDIQQTSISFAYLFLPSANIAVYHSALIYSFFGMEAALNIVFGPIFEVVAKMSI